MPDGYPFSEYDLGSAIEVQKKRIGEEIEAIEADRLLNTIPDSWVDYLQSRYELRIPVLDETAITVDQGEAAVDVSRDFDRVIFDRSRPLFSSVDERGRILAVRP